MWMADCHVHPLRVQFIIVPLICIPYSLDGRRSRILAAADIRIAHAHVFVSRWQYQNKQRVYSSYSLRFVESIVLLQHLVVLFNICEEGLVRQAWYPLSWQARHFLFALTTRPLQPLHLLWCSCILTHQSRG